MGTLRQHFFSAVGIGLPSDRNVTILSNSFCLQQVIPKKKERNGKARPSARNFFFPKFRSICSTVCLNLKGLIPLTRGWSASVKLCQYKTTRCSLETWRFKLPEQLWSVVALAAISPHHAP